MRGDPGLEVVEHIRAAFDPGAAWSEPEVRGFTWWPAHFSQRVACDDARTVDGIDWYRVQVELELLFGVAGSGVEFARIAVWNALNPGLSALRWNGDAGTVSLCATVYVRDGDWERGARDLATAALLQLGDAARDGAKLATDLSGELADSVPPSGVRRAEPDALIEGWRQIASVGAKPNPYTALRLQSASAMPNPPWTRVSVDAAGLHAELPCALAGEAPPGSAPGVGVAILHLLTSQPHPTLGAGIVAALTLPPEAEPVRERMMATSALLNEAEAREFSRVDGTGSWCFHPAAGLAYVSFMPALLDEPNRIEQLTRSMAYRAVWARGFLARVAQLRDRGGPPA